jgi:glucokinase
LHQQVERRFVVVSGSPGSGKSWLALKLAPLLGLAVIDKDRILERLFDAKGIGDAAWRRTLSRESDLIFRRESEDSNGALLVSFWHLPGMAPDLGTPADWLMGLSNQIVNLHCECPAEVAAARFSQRTRHPGHLDSARSREEILISIEDLARFKALEIWERVSVNTSGEVKPAAPASQICRAFERTRRLVNQHFASTPASSALSVDGRCVFQRSAHNRNSFTAVVWRSEPVPKRFSLTLHLVKVELLHGLG